MTSSPTHWSRIPTCTHSAGNAAECLAISAKRTILCAMDVTLQPAVELRAEGEDSIARCRGIDVAIQADWREDASENLREALALWFVCFIAGGVLDEALRESGFRGLGLGEGMPDDAASLAVTRDSADSSAEETVEQNLPRSTLPSSEEAGRESSRCEYRHFLHEADPTSHASV